MSTDRPDRLVKLLASTTFGLTLLSVGLLVMMFGRRGASGSLSNAFADDAIRDQLIAELVSNTRGIYDSHPDPDVGRVILQKLEGTEFKGAAVHSNEMGLREEHFRLGKPENNIRIVILGDSYVMGYGVEQDERMGSYLQDWIHAAVPDFPHKIEVLHFGVGGWNLTAECQFLRRQLSEIDPDLVVHLCVSNDLDDGMGVRGFGTLASFSAQHRGRANGRVYYRYPVEYAGKGNTNMILGGVDWESRERYEEARGHIARLHDELDRIGCGYLFTGTWGRFNAQLLTLLRNDLDESEFLFVPGSFTKDSQYWVSESDSHWNPSGHELYAGMIWTAIRERGLLPELDLPPAPEREAAARPWIEEGWNEAALELPYWALLPSKRWPEIDFRDLTDDTMRQVHGGVDDRGAAAPYASMLVAATDAPAYLEVEAHGLGRPEVDGTNVYVLIDDELVHTWTIEGDEPLDLRVPIPERLRDRGWYSVRFRSDDWVYTGPARRTCQSFWLDRVTITD